MKMTDLIDFEIKKDHIENKNGKFYFYRVFPPNMSIMSRSEKLAQALAMQSLLDTNEGALHILAMDKSEDLSRNKQFWLKVPERFAFIASDILDSISEIESTSSGIQRAYYFVLKAREPEQVKLFENLLGDKGLRFHKAARPELITVTRNFVLRDFVGDFDLYTFEQEVQKLYENQKGAAK